jgi:anti-sigma regulatory factor (Ser/Thr protein kinase)
MRPTELILHNHPSATRKLRATLDGIADAYDIPSDERFELKFAATEALTNALKSASEDPIHVRIVPSEENIEIEVRDRGGFGPARGLESEGGRGIPLMLALVDEVEFSSSAAGTRVRMRKRLRPHGQAEAPDL